VTKDSVENPLAFCFHLWYNALGFEEEMSE